ncbi:hypothetical protein HCU01_19190 [Halomonas cupida]|uniref:Small CPxCG-related zinc finger protein n=1 Tax=Halomonas cupida TaxID=44933 RepID=A0ABQ0WE96_9GAMM|nr:hypothetical protein HCU01_19190 [Halomonas cupida]
MAEVQYECSKCGRSSSFETDGARMFLLDDDTPRPPTYVVDCPHCEATNTVTVQNE